MIVKAYSIKKVILEDTPLTQRIRFDIFKSKYLICTTTYPSNAKMHH